MTFCPLCGAVVKKEPAAPPGESPPAFRLLGVAKDSRLYPYLTVISICAMIAVIVLLVLLMARGDGTRLTYEVKGQSVDAATMSKAGRIVLERLERLGMPGVRVKTSGRRLTVTVSRAEDVEHAGNVIEQTGQLQFRMVLDFKAAGSVGDDAAWELSTEDELRAGNPVTLTGPPADEEENEYVLKLGPTLLAGTDVESAEVSDRQGEPRIYFTLKPDGARRFAEITGNNVGKQLAIVLDYTIESMPSITKAVTGGRVSVTGDFTRGEAEDLAAMINAGALPVTLTPVRRED